MTGISSFFQTGFLKKILQAKAAERGILKEQTVVILFSPAFPTGLYRIGVTLLGGSGKASVSSPAELKIKDGQATVRLEWSSPNYDYMVVDGVRYEPVNTEGNSVFEIPVSVFDEDFSVTADTTAMSTPHEIEYQLRFDSSSITPDETAERGAKESARDKSVSPLIIAGAAVLIFAGLVIGVIAGRRIAAKKKTR